MNEQSYLLFKLTIGVIATLGLYSILYRENKLYRVFEHLFLGIAAGWALKTAYTDVLGPQYWDLMMGRAPEGKDPGQPGFWAYALIIPFGVMIYFVYSKRHNWISRIPIGILMGAGAGQAIQTWWNIYGPQIAGSMQPLVPSTVGRFTRPATTGLTPDQIKDVTANVYPSQAINNAIFLITLVSVLVYFLFSFKGEGKVIQKVSLTGRWLLMVGFGAIFGTTVMMRFTLLIDRMYFIWIEWLKQGILHR
jgi:hypothetical protein